MSRGSRVAIGVGCAALLLGVGGDVLFRGQPLGLNVLLWTTAFVIALAVLLRVARAPLHQGRRWMVAPLLLFSSAFVWHESPLLTVANLLALAAAVALGALRRSQSHAVAAGVADYAAGLAAAGASAFAGAVHLLHSDIDWDEVGRGAGAERTLSVGRGLALGAPLALLFGGLFMAADAVFRSLVTGAIPTFRHPVEHAVFILAFAWLAAGLLRDLLASREERRLVSPEAIVAKPLPFSLGATEVVVVLAILDLLFLSFVLVQLRYLFGGRGLVEARAHLTYAEYARHGFFELVAVSLLVLPLLLGLDALRRRGRLAGDRLVTLLSACLVALVFVVMVSALQRMRLYELAYGLTELRLYATGVMLWLACVFAWFSVTVLLGRRRLFAVGAVTAGFVATVVLNVVNPDALIARTNLSRPHVDVAYVASLSDDAVPTLLDRLPSLPPKLRQDLARRLLAREEQPVRWQSFNVAHLSASRLLTRHESELRRYALEAQ
jgi:Domain of unknown function (DUF4173)